MLQSQNKCMRPQAILLVNVTHNRKDTVYVGER